MEYPRAAGYWWLRQNQQFALSPTLKTLTPEPQYFCNFDYSPKPWFQPSLPLLFLEVCCPSSITLSSYSCQCVAKTMCSGIPSWGEDTTRPPPLPGQRIPKMEVCVSKLLDSILEVQYFRHVSANQLIPFQYPGTLKNHSCLTHISFLLYSKLM